MTGWPVPPQYAITTPYGKRGVYWSCDEDSVGKGRHTGIDIACPEDTPLYATIAGQIRHRNYGKAFGDKQFAISPDADQPFGAGEVFYAHGNERLADGTRVEVGDYIGKSGVRGNVSGPHLHYEFHPNSKNQWNCSVIADPAPTLSNGDSNNPDDGPYVTMHVYRSKCGYGEPTNGDAFSDTVKELQHRLNRISLTGGTTLAITGRYDERTDAEVRKWQDQICNDPPDPALMSYLGPNQFAEMFPADRYTLHDDGDPAVAGTGEGTVPPASGSDLHPPDGPLTTMGARFARVCAAVTAPVYYEPDWDSDTIAGKGLWDPSHLMMHHTAGHNSLDWILYGGDYQPVRLANFLVDKDGTLHVCAARKTYHAGKGSWPGVSTNQMNDYSGGVEIESRGERQDLTDAQILTVRQLGAAWLTEFGFKNLDLVLNHRDWSTTGKTDTLYERSWWQDQIREEMASGIPEPPDPPDLPDLPEPPDLPDLPEPPDLPETITLPRGVIYHYSGKPSGTFTFSGAFKYLDIPAWAPPKDGYTFGMIYANVDIDGEFQTHLVRQPIGSIPEDPTAYQTHFGDEGGDNFLLTHVWFEKAEANRGLRYGMQSKDGQTGTVGTRYVKFLFVPKDLLIDLGNVAGAYSAARSTYSAVKPYVPTAVGAAFLAWLAHEVKKGQT